MTQATQSHAVPADSPAGANGAGSLSERVKGLRLGDQLGGAKHGGGSSWLPWGLCLLMALTWASFAIRAYTSGGWKAIIGKAESGREDRSPGGDAKGDKTTKTATQAAAPGEMVLTVKGYLVAAHQIQVSPIEVSGRVRELSIEEGKRFKKGDVLAELDRVPFDADFKEAEAMLKNSQAKLAELEKTWPLEKDQADAQLREAKSLRDQYQRDLQRYDEIKQKNGIVNDREYDQAKFGLISQEAKVAQLQAGRDKIFGPYESKIDAARAEVLSAQARFDRAAWRRDNCTIRAPVDGVILTKRAEIGNLVNALAMNANLNAGVCDMADLTDMEVDLEVQEREISKVRVGQKCFVIADAYPEWRYLARVDRILPVANSSKAVIPVRVKIRVPRKEEGQRLRPQMGAVVYFFNEDAPPDKPGVEPPDPTRVE